MRQDGVAAFQQALGRDFSGETRFDDASRGRYSTDASIYQIMPQGVVLPRNANDVAVAIGAARSARLPVTGRGGGTSQCGQTVNRGLIFDNSKYFNRILDIDVKNRRAVVQPGLVLDDLNRALEMYGLWFPVDVSTASRATIGGMAANNSCGGRSMRYGTMRSNVISIEAVLADGTHARFAEVGTVNDSTHPAAPLCDQMLALGREHCDLIDARFPKLTRRVGGYNLDALLPGERPVNLSHLLVGSEGTLAYFTELELMLWPVIRRKVLGICHFPSFYQAMEATQHLVALSPLSVELIDNTMIALSRQIPIFRKTIDAFVTGNPAALLLVEFEEGSDAANNERLNRLQQCMGDLGFDWSGQGRQWGGVLSVVEPRLQAQIAEVRKSALNIMMSMKQEGKPISFVEDCAVELADLAEYTHRLTEVFERHGTRGTWYAHASVGCLHVRPVLNMKSADDVSKMRSIAEEAFALVAEYKGSHSGEHGDGIVRSEFHERMFGSRITDLFETVKDSFDPEGLMNPGKIVRAPRMDDRTLFRYPPGYTVKPLKTQFDWSDWPGEGGGFQGAVEMCNNNGACRKRAGGAMCPSYRVTLDERDVTRGRANTLRLAISGQLGADALGFDSVMDSLELCVSCKACRRECPTGVDMAKMKLEVLSARVREHGVSLHDRLVGSLPCYATYASRLYWLANLRNSIPVLARLLERPTGFSASRPLPRWSDKPFRTAEAKASHPDVILFADTFTRYFEPDIPRAALKVLRAAGRSVAVARDGGRRPLCCGRTYLATGQIELARREAGRTLAALLPSVRAGRRIVGLEPSCLLTLRDEIPSLFPGSEVREVAEAAFMIEEYLAAESDAGTLDLTLARLDSKILLHGHCHQKAFDMVPAVRKTLDLIPGVHVEVVESSCCGMAGAFGYRPQTRDISMKMAELSLLPAVRGADASTLIVADGTSCRHQIADGAGRTSLHVAQVLELALAGHGTH